MSSDQKPPEPHDKNTRRPSASMLSLSELIAQTPGAQTREQLLARIKARERKRTKKSPQSAPSEDRLSTPEPLPTHDNPYKDNPYQWAVDHLKRKQAKASAQRKQAEAHAQQKHPKGFKPYLVRKNDEPDPADKK